MDIYDLPPRLLGICFVLAIAITVVLAACSDPNQKQAEAAEAIPDAFKLVNKQYIDGYRVLIIEDNVTHKQYILYSSSCIIPR